MAEKIPTKITIYYPDKEPEERTITMTKEPGYREIKEAILPLIGDGCTQIEHVTVLHKGKRADMFVDEMGALELTTRPPKPWNPKASDIYLNASRQRGDDQANAPQIYGVAVLFDRIIWT